MGSSGCGLGGGADVDLVLGEPGFDFLFVFEVEEADEMFGGHLGSDDRPDVFVEAPLAELGYESLAGLTIWILDHNHEKWRDGDTGMIHGNLQTDVKNPSSISKKLGFVNILWLVLVKKVEKGVNNF